MKKAVTISPEQVRFLALYRQCLLEPAISDGIAATLGIIEQLGYVQIDTLAVVARAHHHVLWSRQPAYHQNNLDTLLEEKKVFEYWGHAASYLPTRDFRFSLPRKQSFAHGRSHWHEKDPKVNKHVLDRIKAEGPLQSKDFEHERKDTANWFEWKPAKRALEQLFMEGRLMVAKRKGFQKIYDLTENVLPSWVDVSMPTDVEMGEHLVLAAIRANGPVNEKEIHYQKNRYKEGVKKALKKLIKEGQVMEAYIEGEGNIPYYLFPADLELQEVNHNPWLHILSPFDNLVIQRKRLKTLFGFDYTIECYVPAPRRQYGYFCLPLFWNNQFVARLDPKADRKTGIFHVKSMHYEKGFRPSAAFQKALDSMLNEFAAFNGCKVVEFDGI